MQQAARLAQADEFIRQLPQGYDTDATEVSYEDGLLTVYIPVKQAKVFEPTVKQLEIN